MTLATDMVLRLYLHYTEPDFDEPYYRQPESAKGVKVQRPYVQTFVQNDVNRVMPPLMHEAFATAMPVALLWQNAARSHTGYTFSWRERRPRK